MPDSLRLIVGEIMSLHGVLRLPMVLVRLPPLRVLRRPSRLLSLQRRMLQIFLLQGGMMGLMTTRVSLRKCTWKILVTMSYLEHSVRTSCQAFGIRGWRVKLPDSMSVFWCLV